MLTNILSISIRRNIPFKRIGIDLYAAIAFVLYSKHVLIRWTHTHPTPLLPSPDFWQHFLHFQSYWHKHAPHRRTHAYLPSFIFIIQTISLCQPCIDEQQHQWALCLSSVLLCRIAHHRVWMGLCVCVCLRVRVWFITISNSSNFIFLPTTPTPNFLQRKPLQPHIHIVLCTYVCVYVRFPSQNASLSSAAQRPSPTLTSLEGYWEVKRGQSEKTTG